jgi:hypothetical protein
VILGVFVSVKAEAYLRSVFQFQPKVETITALKEFAAESFAFTPVEREASVAVKLCAFRTKVSVNVNGTTLKVRSGRVTEQRAEVRAKSGVTQRNEPPFITVAKTDCPCPSVPLIVRREVACVTSPQPKSVSLPKVGFASDNETPIETVWAKGINISEEGSPASPKCSGKVEDESVFVGVDVVGAEETEPAVLESPR